MNSRNDGLIWRCPLDYKSDGIHPSDTGAAKVGGLVLQFFSSDPLTTPWFSKSTSGIVEFESSAAVALSPNPVAIGNEITIGESIDAGCRIQVIDGLGRIVVEQASGTRIRTAALRPGVYGVQYRSRGAVRSAWGAVRSARIVVTP
jgi:hypothetical protein